MFLILTAFLGVSCGTQQVVTDVDNKTGLITDKNGKIARASVINGEKFDLKKFKGNVYFAGNQYAIEQLTKFNLYKKVWNHEDLQRLVVENNLQDKIPTLREAIGLNKLYKHYQPFLWIDFKYVGSGIPASGDHFWQIVAIDPENLKQLFLAQVKIDPWLRNDQNSLHPLFNSLAEWIKSNQ